MYTFVHITKQVARPLKTILNNIIPIMFKVKATILSAQIIITLLLYSETRLIDSYQYTNMKNASKKKKLQRHNKTTIKQFIKYLQRIIILFWFIILHGTSISNQTNWINGTDIKNIIRFFTVKI